MMKHTKIEVTVFLDRNKGKKYDCLLLNMITWAACYFYVSQGRFFKDVDGEIMIYLILSLVSKVEQKWPTYDSDINTPL